MKQVLDALHDQVGHQTTERTRDCPYQIFWPGKARDVEEHCKICKPCMLAEAGKQCRPMIGSFTASRPLEVLAIDCTLLNGASNCLENVLVITDIFTNLIQAAPTCDEDSSENARG